MKDSIKKLIDLLGGKQQDLADVLKTEEYPVTQAHVHKWLHTTKRGMPDVHVIPACKAVSWRITPHELRPDIYPHPTDGLPAELRCECERLMA